MNKPSAFMAVLAAISVAVSACVADQGRLPDKSFQRISTFVVRENTAGGQTSVAEILAATPDGHHILYTDAESGRLGFLDIREPEHPKGDGSLSVDGSPTSVVVHRQWALVVVDRGDFQGHLEVVDLSQRKVTRRLELDGQPDSIALSPDGRYAAVAVENENTAGETLPPPGWLSVISLTGQPADWEVRRVDLQGLANTWPDDPEPEFVDINEQNLALVSLQENNHLALIDLEKGEVVDHFSAGKVDLHEVDLADDRRIVFRDSRFGVPREPDSVAWTSRGFATADEGDLEGGSRSFTLFERDGRVAYWSGPDLEHVAARHGHYPDSRSDKRGTEPEGLEVARFDDREFLFVGLERASLVVVYELKVGRPVYHQVLPCGVGPEGIVAVPGRNLLAVAAEVDKPKKGVTSTITVYRWADGAPAYPHLVSEIGGWAGLSGLTSDPKRRGRLYAVEDKQRRPSRILSIDAARKPARITGEIALRGTGGEPLALDPEGVTCAEDGGFWVVSEGKKKEPNLLLKFDGEGRLQTRAAVPQDLAGSKTKHGFEGVAVIQGKVYVAFQRSWSDDPKGQVRLGRYDPNSGGWSFARYPLEHPENGLSGLARWGEKELAVLERCDQAGPEARLKSVFLVKTEEFDEGTLSKTLLVDLIPHYLRLGGLTPEKVEGITRDAAGTLWVVNDNDGTDDSNGETVLLPINPER